MSAFMLKPTLEKAEEIGKAFDAMILAIPKTRRGDHVFVINEVSLIIKALKRKAAAEKSST